MSTLCLSGWGQPYDALKVIAPDAAHVDYAHNSNIGDALAQIAHMGQGRERVIGWSLGGQLAVRAIHAGLLRPKMLVLIAAPYQFVQTPEKAVGMKRDLYDKFRGNYARNAARTLDKAWELIPKGDMQEEKIRALMTPNDKQVELKKNWLYWLDALESFSCDSLSFADFPPTLLINGTADAVVEFEQQAQFAARIPHARALALKGCGHAPHWHDTSLVAKHV